MTLERKLAIAASIVTIAAYLGFNISKPEKAPPNAMICKSVETSNGASTSCSGLE